MTQKKLYTAPTAAVFHLYAEQPMLNTSVTISDDVTDYTLTNQKGFNEGNIWSNMRDGSEYDM